MTSLTITCADIDTLLDELNTTNNDPEATLFFDEERRLALKNYDDIQACPGSGKTTLVAAKLIILAKKWRKAHSGICVLTHTKTAKKEILTKLQKHPAGFKLTTYPHFIGTIQEFVNRFLGIPYCKSCSWPVNQIDDDICVAVLWRRLNPKTKIFFEKRPNISLYGLKLSFENGKFQRNVPGFKKPPKESPSYDDLVATKKGLIESGFYYYSEMYAFGAKLLQDNEQVKRALQKRFPIVLIDEMQDTQKYQDDLINQIFDCDAVVIQRFGDPDQAIFDGLGGGEPNESYNNRKDLSIIESSHRFGNDIAQKIKGLSYQHLQNLNSSRNSPKGDAPHTIFLYDDQSIEQVLGQFSQLVVDNLSEEKRQCVKAVGSVGKEKSDGLTIKHYWSEYDKTKSSKSFKPTKLIHIVRKCSEFLEGNVADNYELLLQGVVDLLRMANKKSKNLQGKEVYYSKISFIKELKAFRDKYQKFRQFMTSCIINNFPDQESWEAQMAELKNLLELGGLLNEDALSFIEYDENYSPVQEIQPSANNIYEYKIDSVVKLKIEVSTIHAVKGETHDATLILETKFRRNDISTVLEYLIDDSLERPNRPQKTGFMRKLYVAGTRPRHLLCLALSKNNISIQQIEILCRKGWKIKDITGE